MADCVGRTVLSDAFDFGLNSDPAVNQAEAHPRFKSPAFVGQECPTHTRPLDAKPDPHRYFATPAPGA